MGPLFPDKSLNSDCEIESTISFDLRHANVIHFLFVCPFSSFGRLFFNDSLVVVVVVVVVVSLFNFHR